MGYPEPFREENKKHMIFQLLDFWENGKNQQLYETASLLDF